MNSESIVCIARKAVYVLAFLTFFCIPVSGGRGWAPMLIFFIGGWGATYTLVIVSRICITVALFMSYKLLSNNDQENGPLSGYWVLGLLSLSIILLMWEMHPMRKAMAAVFMATIFVCGLLAICDALTLRWLAKRERQVANDKRAT